MTTRNLNFRNQKTVGYLNHLIEKFEHFGEYHSNQGNQTERGLSGQLILLTTVLITVNVLVLGDGTIVSHSTPSQKFLILLALIFEGLATVAGIINYILLERSYDKWSAINFKCAKIVEAREYKTSEELNAILTAEQEDIGHSFSKAALYAQVLFILASMGIYIALLHSIFFPA